MRKSTQVTEQVSPLELQLPDIFNITPDYTIALPANCRALIYNTSVREREYDTKKHEPYYVTTPAWRIIVVNKNGRRPRALEGCRYDDGASVELTNPLDVKRHIEKVAWKLSKVKVTTVIDEDADD